MAFFLGDPDEGGAPIGEVPLADLAPGAEALAELSWAPVTSRGSLGLFVIADWDEDVDEADESDNVAFRPFNALGLPNLVLTAGAVVLDPVYPQEGESVTIQASVRNLGSQPSAPTSVQVVEGEPGGSVVGSLTLPALGPGALETVTLSWSPSAPAGARPIRLTVDPDELVAEQDEGDNTVRVVVVVQDGDLYLSAPYFSPNGDGVLDETSLSWRATVPVTATILDPLGIPVRTLVVDGPETGSVSWDGQDERGSLLWDGAYSVVLNGEDDRSLARVTVVLDTNRSPIHEATAPRDTFARNLTCGLPSFVRELAWTAGEEALLAVVWQATEGFPLGLVRVGLDGAVSYVSQDPWYSLASVAGPAAASPDGRSVLVFGSGGLHSVDLVTGARQPLGGFERPVGWSPDGRFVVAGDSVLARDGSPVADLSGRGVDRRGSAWAWSPSSDRLAQGGAVVARDGDLLFDLGLLDEYGTGYPEWTVWRGDGRIATGLYTCPDEGEEFSSAVFDGDADPCRSWYLIDPVTRTSEPLEWSSAAEPAWSPDGTRVVTWDGEIRLEDGTLLGRLLDTTLRISPRSSAGLYFKSEGADLPGTICPSKPWDIFALSTVANLTAELEVARLPGNAGLVLRGTAADRYLERFELDFARTDDPETWHPIGAAFDVPVVSDTFAVWVPPGPGTYVVRLRVRDRAGNARTRTRTASWDRVASLVNFTQSTYFLSPDGNGVKDEVEFRYLVAEPTRLDIRIVGPEPASDDAPAAGEIRRLAFEYSNIGTQSFTWDGTDAGNRLVPDGLYTVFLNDLPFRVEVDVTPPEIDLRFENSRAEPADLFLLVQGGCVAPGDARVPSRYVTLGGVRGDSVWHVVDPNLREWAIRGGSWTIKEGTDAIFVAETDSRGEPGFRARRSCATAGGGEAGQPAGHDTDPRIRSV